MSKKSKVSKVAATPLKVSKSPKIVKPEKFVLTNQVFGEVLQLGHLIKYNLYVLTKALVFQSLVDLYRDPDKAAAETNRIIMELDLDTKAQIEAIKKKLELEQSAETPEE